MTKEEIHTQIQIAITDACENSSLSFYSKDDVRNEISNTYENILELIKYKTCKHCKYLNRTKQNVLLCDINNISNGTDYGALSVDEDFGCNKFEEK